MCRSTPTGAAMTAKSTPKPPPHQQLLLHGFEEAIRQAESRREIAKLGIAQAALLDDGSDISFLHRGFAHCGLPLRKRDDAKSVWNRSDGRFSLSVVGSSFTLPDSRQVDVGIPYGPKARLIALYLCSQVKDPARSASDRDINFAPITQWLRDVGVTARGGAKGSIQATKEQLIRMTFASFTMTMAGAENQTWFHRETLVESGCLSKSDLANFAGGHYAALEWPEVIRLTHNAHQRMRDQAIPIATQRLQAISHSAAAMDFFVWLSFRLPRIPQGDSIPVSWSALARQFGDSLYPSQFRRDFTESLRVALAAYPEANVVIGDDGLVLRRSDPAVPRKTLIAISGGRK